MYNEEDENYSAADEILNQLEDQEEMEMPDGETLNWAVQRIEEANLFKYLLVTPIFTEKSADPSIVASVNSKIARFAMEELKELLGGKREESVVRVAESQFNDNEVFALKTIAAKVIEKTSGTSVAPEERTPTINPIDVGSKQISTNKVMPSPQPKASSPAPAKQAAKAPTKQVVKKSTKGMTEAEVKKQRILEKNAARVAPTPPIQPIAQPVNGTWAQGQAFANQGRGQSVLSSIVGLELATPMTPVSSGQGSDSAIEFDPDQQ
jgi:hypothetical protein